jgi:Thioredoxin
VIGSFGHTAVIRRDSKVHADSVDTPTGHTPQGGVIVGRSDAKRSMILFEDPQCPYCRQFEELNGGRVTTAIDAGVMAVEYRMRCFLGPESVRADNALALAAEAGRFDELRKSLFAAQPPEGTGGFTNGDLLELGAEIGLVDSDFVSGVQGGRYEAWVLRREKLYQSEDPAGTPAAWLDGKMLDPGVLFDASAFGRKLGD